MRPTDRDGGPAADRALAAIAADRGIDVAILLFPEVEVLDFAGPFEVFSVAGRLHRPHDHPAFHVSTVAAAQAPVRARHGLTVTPSRGFADGPMPDLLIVPGGIVDQPLGDPATLAWIGAAAAKAPLTASVCTGAFLLAALGLLDGRAATTHWQDLPALRARHPGIRMLEDVPYVDEGAIVTAAGISAGIDMSLHLVRRVLGGEAARRTARQMQYDWSDNQDAAAIPAVIGA